MAREITQRAIPRVKPLTYERKKGLKALEDEIDRSLIAAYGVWIAGWRWSTSEPGGGGPVQAWCCASDSLPKTLPTDGVVAAILDWLDWLVALDGYFDEIDRQTEGLSAATRIERAAAQLLAIVVARTEANDAWYQTFFTTLGWYIERREPALSPQRVIYALARGRFDSWGSPPAEERPALCATLGEEIARSLTTLATDDALAAWQRTRAEVRWHVNWNQGFEQRTRVARDGHRDYIARHDRARGAERGDRLDAALTEIRHAATEGAPLSFALLARCQRHVLGTAEPPAFRSHDAYAKGGLERYGWNPNTEAAFERQLAEASDPSLILASRAARVFLDVCFYHPYEDGNARAARLALDYVLTRAGYALDIADPTFSYPRWADDVGGATALIVTLARLLAPS